MRFQICGVIAAILIGVISEPTRACSLDPFLFQLPGETEEQARQRSEKVLSDYVVKAHFDREEYNLKHASGIYLARVLSRIPGEYETDRTVLPSTTVQPIHALKGSLPPGTRTLVDQAEGGACTDIGDGHGA